MYKLIVIWNDGTKETHHYETMELAEEAEYGLRMAFGSQVWTGIQW